MQRRTNTEPSAVAPVCGSLKSTLPVQLDLQNKSDTTEVLEILRRRIVERANLGLQLTAAGMWLSCPAEAGRYTVTPEMSVGNINRVCLAYFLISL